MIDCLMNQILPLQISKEIQKRKELYDHVSSATTTPVRGLGLWYSDARKDLQKIN